MNVCYQSVTISKYGKILFFTMAIDIYLMLDLFGSLFVCSILIKLIIQLDKKNEKHPKLTLARLLSTEEVRDWMSSKSESGAKYIKYQYGKLCSQEPLKPIRVYF